MADRYATASHELPDGTVVHGTGNQWPFTANGLNNNQGQERLPAARVVKEIETSGKGQVVTDNNPTINQAIDSHNSSISLDPGGCGCSASGQGPRPGSLLWLGLVALGWGFVRRT